MFGVRRWSTGHGILWEISSGCFQYAALLGSTVDTCFASVYEAFWKNFTRLERILAHASDYGGSRVEVAVLAVDKGSGMCLADLLVTLHPALCSLVCLYTTGFAGDDAHHDRLS